MRVQIVSFHCVLKNNLGEFISSSFNHEMATSTEEKQAFALPGLVKALKELKKGKKRKVYVSAEEGYGFYNPALLVTVPRSKLTNGKKLNLGDQFMGKLNADADYLNYRVVGVEKNSVTLDGNHPLAGQDLVFEVEVTESRTVHEAETAPSIGRNQSLLC